MPRIAARSAKLGASSPQAKSKHSQSNKSSSGLPGVSNEDLRKLLAVVSRLTKGSGETDPEDESWLDWGLKLLQEWGPRLLELAPMLLALL